MQQSQITGSVHQQTKNQSKPFLQVTPWQPMSLKSTDSTKAEEYGPDPQSFPQS